MQTEITELQKSLPEKEAKLLYMAALGYLIMPTLPTRGKSLLSQRNWEQAWGPAAISLLILAYMPACFYRISVSFTTLKL